MLGIFLDSETNGLNPQKNRIIEIAFKIIDLYTGIINEDYHSVVAQPDNVWKQSNLKSLEITGFTFDDMKQGKTESKVANDIINIFEKANINNENAVFICQNPSFDRTFFSQLIDADMQDTLNWPYHWLDLASMYWAISMKKVKIENNLFPWQTGFSKDLIASTYNLPTEQQPHRAMNGVNHLILCYKAVVGFPYIEKKFSN